MANRDKDRVFVSALIESRLVDPRIIEERTWVTNLSDDQYSHIQSFLTAPIREWNQWNIQADIPNNSLTNPGVVPMDILTQQALEHRRVLAQ